MKLHIPRPCHEDWNQMLPEEQGRHCQLCSKTVIDFTTWEPEAIRDYMKQRSGEKVCGRFTAGQLDSAVKPEDVNWPASIALSGLSFFKKVAALIVVVFGLMASSCDNKVEMSGAIKPPSVDTTIKKNAVMGDSVESRQREVLVGEPIVLDSPKCVKEKAPKQTRITHFVQAFDSTLMGDIIPDEAVDSTAAGASRLDNNRK